MVSAGGFDGKGDVVICYDCGRVCLRQVAKERFAGRNPAMLMS